MHDPHDHSHDHEHSHDHGDGQDPHAPQRDHDAVAMSGYEVLEETLRLLLIEKGIITHDEVARQIDLMDSRSPALGAQVVVRAWLDAEFKGRLLRDAREALKEFDVDIGSLAEFKVVENTPETHNVVVCTLCSCYPKMLLGVPPAWYKSMAYRSRTVIDPRGVLTEFGLDIPLSREVRVHDSTADLRYIVLPMRPADTDELDETALVSLITRDCMIGTAEPSRVGRGA
ncbi:MAG: nitrile hydratase subunit alpha [Hyphomicrobiaceae bacterium]